MKELKIRSVQTLKRFVLIILFFSKVMMEENIEVRVWFVRIV